MEHFYFVKFYISQTDLAPLSFLLLSPVNNPVELAL